VTILEHIQVCPTRFLAQKTFVILKKGGQIKSSSWRGELVARGRCDVFEKNKKATTVPWVLCHHCGVVKVTIIDIKIVDPFAASYVHATAKSALHRHRALEAAGPRDYFGPSRRPPHGARMRVVTFVVSTFGSLGLGAQAQTLIKDIGRRTNLFVPFSLADETSWATSSITTFLRSALTFQVRQRAAVILREHLPDDDLDFLPPPPI